MTLRTYSDAAAFLSDVREPLERHEAINSLPLGICLRLAQAPTSPVHEPYFASVYDSGRLSAAAVMTPPYSLIPISDSDDTAPFEPILRDLADRGLDVPGVTGRTPIAALIAEMYSRLTGCSVLGGADMRLFSLTAVTDPIPAPGAMRAATPADIDLLTAWAQAFHDESTPHSPRPDMRQMVAGKIGQSELYVWDHGRPVSMAARARPTRRSATINYVYTPPEHRGRGYASCCTAALSRLLLDEGYEYCVLFTDLANPTSNSIYRKIGYRPVCDFAEYRFAANAPSR